MSSDTGQETGGKELGQVEPVNQVNPVTGGARPGGGGGAH